MLERQEIDALLISALYGELSPAEEARLASHLEAHPADKTALAALTSTREAVRDSRILQVQVEPPQSVSALLLQEAHRRAPKPAEKDGWFARLARSFMAHPAMAAAAMLVVVLGVATLVRNKKGDHFAESSAPDTTEKLHDDVTGGGMTAATPPAQPSDQPDRQRMDHGVAAGSGAIAAPQGQAMAGSNADSYRVGLADDGDKNIAGRKLDTTTTEEAATQAEAKIRADVAKTQAAKSELAKTEPSLKPPENAKGKDSAPVAKKSGSKAPSGAMELRRPDPSPKDLEGDNTRDFGGAVDDTGTLSKEQVNAITPGPSAGAGGTPGASGRGEGAQQGYAVPPPATGSAPATTTKPPVREPSVAQKPADTRTTTTSNTTAANNRPGQAPPRNQTATASPPPPPAKVATAPTPAPARDGKVAEKPRAAAPAEDKSVNDPQLAWAREQHTAIIAKVRAGDCKGAAQLAVNLANRDVAYYQQNVATDRSVKECLAYITAAREKEASERAEKQRASQKRATEPAKATSVDAAH